MTASISNAKKKEKRAAFSMATSKKKKKTHTLSSTIKIKKNQKKIWKTVQKKSAKKKELETALIGNSFSSQHKLFSVLNLDQNLRRYNFLFKKKKGLTWLCESLGRRAVAFQSPDTRRRTFSTSDPTTSMKKYQR
jgi:hypothetical protein